MGSIPNLRLRKPGLTYEDDEIAPTVGGGINKKKWYNLMPLFVALVVIAEIGFLGRLYMAKNVDLVNSWAESFYQFTTSSSSSSSSWAEDAVEVGGGEVVSGGEICEEWLERQDSVVCSRDFQTDPIFVNGGEKAQTVKVCNVSLGATEQDIKEFFSFSGEIEYVEMQSESEQAQTAFVTFKDLQGAETAVLLSGATIVDQSVTIALAPDYKLPPSASAPPRFHAVENQNLIGAGSVVQKAEDVISSMLAKGFILGKDAVNKAKSFDEKLRLTSMATATVTSLDQKIGLSRKINIGTTIVNDKVKEMDQKFQVSEKTKSAIAAAEQTVSSAGSAIMKNRYFLTGTSWVTGAYSKVTKAAGEVGQKTKEKVMEEEQGRNAAQGYAQVHD